MPTDPSRRPSSERVRVEVNFDALVWLECGNCLGDGWTFNGHNFAPDRTRSTRKNTCSFCGGLGATQVKSICCGPQSRVVTEPRGWASAVKRT
jgi:hypothetical protein